MPTRLRKYRKTPDAITSGPAANSRWQNQKPHLTSKPSTPERLIRLEEVQQLVGLGKTMIYEMIATGRFPSPYKVSSAARWSQHEVFNWIEDIKGSQTR